MITCYVRYVIDPNKVNEFEQYGKLWLPLVEKFGGTHHGYFVKVDREEVASVIGQQRINANGVATREMVVDGR